MRETLLILFMCCQVLVCPALCISKCAQSEFAECNEETNSGCHCCGKSQSAGDDSNGVENARSTFPPSPSDSSDCSDCFCSGTSLISKEAVVDLEFSPVSHALASTETLNLRLDGLASSFDRSPSPLPIYGRGLLSRYCVLLI
jgi:hypothetical protein